MLGRARPNKTDSRLEIRTEQSRPIPDLTFEICSSECGHETYIDLNKVAFLDDKCIGPKTGCPEIDLD